MERATGAAKCGHCGGRRGVGGVPLVTMFGEWHGSDSTTYDASRRCPRCGAEPPRVINIVTPLLRDVIL
jgi:hypothetical protein